MPSESENATLETIHCETTVGLTPVDAFGCFTADFNAWWPRQYTWSREVLDMIGIEPITGGLCFERGPHHFRCDWGRVLVWDPPERLVFTWQVGPRREPVPDPARASRVEVRFERSTDNATRVVLEHSEFERHGDGAEEYRAALASSQGWPLILERYKSVCDAH